MRILITVFIWIAIMLLIGQLFIWFLAIGSGHNIPSDTTSAFLRNVVILLIISVGLSYWKSRISN